MEHKIKYYFYILLSLLLINPIFTIFPEKNINNRFLDIGNKIINNSLNNSNTTKPFNETDKYPDETNPYFLFIGSYIQFIFLGLYFFAY